MRQGTYFQKGYFIENETAYQTKQSLLQWVISL